MADGRKGNGGARSGAGRKAKIEEQALVEKLKPMEGEALKALHAAVKKGERWAVTLFMAYQYGKPKEKKELAVDLSKLTDTEIDDLLNKVVQKMTDEK